jgi:hypothetical protein
MRPATCSPIDTRADRRSRYKGEEARNGDLIVPLIEPSAWATCLELESFGKRRDTSRSDGKGRSRRNQMFVLFSVFILVQLLPPAAGQVSVTIGTTGTDDAVLIAEKGLKEGVTTCASATNCFVSADALQGLLASNNVSITVTGRISISAAPTNGQALTSADVSLTLAAGSSSSSLDHILIEAPLNLGSRGSLNLVNQAVGGITCVVGTAAASFGTAPLCTSTGGTGACQFPGLLCLLDAELQYIVARSVSVSNTASAAKMALNGLDPSDTAGMLMLPL